MNIINKLIQRFLLSDYPSYFRPIILKELKDDLLKNKDISLKQKIWCYNRGFFSNKIKLLGINEENYKNYISDFSYYKSWPINGEFSKWIDCKLTTAYILQPFKEYLPKHYFQLYRNSVIKLIDCPSEYESNLEGIISLLKIEGELAVKLLGGSRGKGFYKFTYIDNNFYINDKKVNYEEIINLLNKLNNYIITEYLHVNKDIGKIFNITPNALRVITVYDEEDGPQITRAFMRFGTMKSGIIEHSYAGGICTNIDIDTGEFFDPRITKDGSLVECKIHPDTGENIEGILPHWNLIKSKLKEMSKYMPQLIYMGWDIVITDDGFKILEINSFPGINTLQYYQPLHKNKYNKKLFNKYLQN